MNLLHAGLVAIARYSLPLYPLMTLVIAAWWMDKRQRRRGREAQEIIAEDNRGMPSG